MITLRNTVMPISPVHTDMTGDALLERFQADPESLLVPVVEDGHPVGLVERNAFFLTMASEYGRAIYAKRSISLIMDPAPLIVEADTPLGEFTERVLKDRFTDVVRGYIVTDRGVYVGVGTALDLLKANNKQNQVIAETLASVARQAERSRLFTDAVIESIPVMIFVKDAVTRRYILMNRAGEEMMGVSRDTFLGSTATEVYDAERAAIFDFSDEQLLASCEVQVLEKIPTIAADGAERLIKFKKTLIDDDRGSGRYILGVGVDITETERAQEKIERLAHYDSLTDLPNRVLFRSSLEAALVKSRRRTEHIAVLCIDLDHFKEVNDTLGHPVGDALLCAVADRMRACIRHCDTVARLGGDEFAVVQTGLASADDAAQLAGRIVATLSRPFDLQGHEVVIGASIGVAISPKDGIKADDILKKADIALYEVKSEGRNGYRFFESHMDERLHARRILEGDLRRAFGVGEFCIVYQPQLNVATGRIDGCEAFLRWNHPERGLITPAEFISATEDIGLIGPLGEWILREACAEACNWPREICVAVNVSPVQFRNPEFVATVVSALAETGLPPSQLELEITESVLLQDSPATLTMLHQLRGLGVRIAMDDFGTGYSSLSYLRSFPFDKIKIDQTFVKDLPDDKGSLAIIKAVTSLAESLGVTTTAEGVESQAQLEQLTKEGCTQVQGYYIGRPMDREALHDRLRAEHPDAPGLSGAIVKMSEPMEAIAAGASANWSRRRTDAA